MTQTLTLPSVASIPDNIDEQLRDLLQQPRDPALGEWLLELIKASGHLSTPDHLRWRVVCLVWLAAEFEVARAWPYLMWLNTGQPVITEHLAELLSDGTNDLDCHVQLANWIAQARDERLITFFSDFHHIPARYNMPGLIKRLLSQPTAPEVGVWLAAYCRDTADNQSLPLRPWRMLTAAWYATCFDSIVGLEYLEELSGGEATLSPIDNKILTDLANELNCLNLMSQWVGTCPDPDVRTMLKDFGHPDLKALIAAIFQQPPYYQHLADSIEHVEADIHLFNRTVRVLEQAGLNLQTAKILDLACGPLAAQTLLFNSAGYKTVGVDLHIPPAYLPLPGFKQWFQRGKYVKAWQEATAAYYQALAQHSNLKLKWNGVKIELADLTRLQFPNHSFDVVICLKHLPHTPDVEGLLAEAARVLKSGGVLVASIRPYAALSGAFSPDGAQPWSHLRRQDETLPTASNLTLNQWREHQYQATFEKFFSLEQWQTEQDDQALSQLTPAIRAELADYDEAELTRKQIMVLARKK
jgi:SAM-dependent methyltransferase